MLRSTSLSQEGYRRTHRYRQGKNTDTSICHNMGRCPIGSHIQPSITPSQAGEPIYNNLIDAVDFILEIWDPRLQMNFKTLSFLDFHISACALLLSFRFRVLRGLYGQRLQKHVLVFRVLGTCAHGPTWATTEDGGSAEHVSKT